ncbi:MAG: sun protein [Acidobacteria bacterium]|nr:sun protein [Acidobacteriota bacterium]
MSAGDDRERSLQLIRRIQHEGLYASLVLHDESGFVRTLVLGVLRWRSWLDFVIEHFARRRIEKIDPIVVEVLRLGIYQLLYTDVAPYAAVSETVDLAARHAARARGFVNAILRRVSEGNLPTSPDVATRTAHPRWLIDRWTRLYGAERTAAIAAADQELSYPDVVALAGEAPPEGTASTLVDDVYKLTGSSAELDRARFWPMDEGSAVIAAIAANAGGPVLDMAAAPGGKSIYIAHRGVRVISNDVSPTRLLPLRRRIATLVVSDGREPPFARPFRTVLLDAPCSATGTIRKNPELKWRLRESDLSAFAALQRELLASALTLASETVVYSTCSLEREENDLVIDAVLADDPSFARASVGELVPPGASSWVDDGVLRLTPESGADGFTCFVLRRR